MNAYMLTILQTVVLFGLTGNQREGLDIRGLMRPVFNYDQAGFAITVAMEGISVVERRYAFAPRFVWMEQAAGHYRKRDVAGLRFRRPYANFVKYTRLSRRDRELGDIRFVTADHWGRVIGESVEGRVASGTYWYLRVRREGGKWRVWRIEYCDHH